MKNELEWVRKLIITLETKYYATLDSNICNSRDNRGYIWIWRHRRRSGQYSQNPFLYFLDTCCDFLVYGKKENLNSKNQE